MPYSWNVFSTMSRRRLLPPTYQRRALTMFDVINASPTRYVATCAVCSQLTSSAVLLNIACMLLWTQLTPACSPDGE